jgi:hypothetical protein
MIGWLTLLLSTWEVPGSNLDLDNQLSSLKFQWFSSVPSGEYHKIRPEPFPTEFFPIHHYSLITSSSTLYSLVTEKVSYNKLTTNSYKLNKRTTYSPMEEGIAYKSSVWNKLFPT